MKDNCCDIQVLAIVFLSVTEAQNLSLHLHANLHHIVGLQNYIIDKARSMQVWKQSCYVLNYLVHISTSMI